MKNILAAIAVIITITASCLAGVNYFCPMSEHLELAGDYNQFKQTYRINQIQQRIWQLESYYQCIGIEDCSRKIPPQIFNEYRALVSELNALTVY